MRIAGLRHHDFITLGLATATLPRMSSPRAAALRAGLRAAGEYTAAFLDAQVAARASGGIWLAASPTAHGFPEGLVTVTPMKPRAGPP